MNDIEIRDSSKSINLVPASIAKRISNYLIDSFIFSFVIIFVTATYGVDVIAVMQNEDSKMRFNFFMIILLIGYYILFESLLGGKSPAKYLTKTRVVNLDGSRPDLDTIAKRSFCRAIPLEFVSFLFQSRPVGWHDRFSKTIVVEEGTVGV